MIGSIVYMRSYESLILMNIISGLISIIMLAKLILISKLTSWHIIDIFRELLLIVYTIENFTDNKTEIEVVLILVVFLSSVQGVYFFALFESTRLLTKSIAKLVLKLFNLLIVLIYLFSMLSVVLNTSKYSIDIKEILVFNNIYLTLLSFLILSLILGLTTYKYKFEKDVIEIASILIELEKLMFWKRNAKKIYFFQVCKPTTSIKVKCIQKSINYLQDYFSYNEIINSKLHTIQKQCDDLHFSSSGPPKNNQFN